VRTANKAGEKYFPEMTDFMGEMAGRESLI
jgi:hypothetical protein